jgi:hypothetical protein
MALRLSVSVQAKSFATRSGTYCLTPNNVRCPAFFVLSPLSPALSALVRLADGANNQNDQDNHDYCANTDIHSLFLPSH